MRTHATAILMTSLLLVPTAGLAQTSRSPASTPVSARGSQPPLEEPFVAAGVVMLSPRSRVDAGSPRLALPRRAAVEGLWIEFANARWFASGRAEDPDAARFEPVGEYRGFPVYRERGRPDRRIYVTITPDGPLAPYERR